jgi:hypothetical protein
MKHLLWLFLIWAFQQIAAGSDVVSKTERMKQIESKFGMTIIFVTEDEKQWIFVGTVPQRMFHVLPVCVPANAFDRDVKVAIDASNNTAVFYEKMLEKSTTPTEVICRPVRFH